MIEKIAITTGYIIAGLLILAIGLGALVLIIYLVTVAKMLLGL